MDFEHIGYEQGTGRASKQVETYNFYKAAAVLAEYGFECVRLSNDWEAVDFLAHHTNTGTTLKVQLKTCLIIDERLVQFDNLYMCFPIDKTDGNWYLVEHARLLEIVKEHACQWFQTAKWRNNRGYWTYTAPPAVTDALEPFAYRSIYGDRGYREARALKKVGAIIEQIEHTGPAL